MTDQLQPPSQPTQQQPGPAYQPAASRRLARRTDDKWIAGVCSGVAAYLDVDVTVVRLLTLLGAIFGLGSIVVVYVVLWAVMPQQ